VGQAGEGGVSRSEEEGSEPEYIPGQINREGHAMGGGGSERQREDYAEALRVMVALEQVVSLCTCFTGKRVHKYKY